MAILLDAEIQQYNRQLPKLLAHPGKFATLSADNLVGIFDTYKDALAAGYKQFGLKPFLVKRIQEYEQIQYFTRDIPVEQCPT